MGAARLLLQERSGAQSLDALSGALEAAATDDLWWDALSGRAQELGLAALRWNGPAGVREAVFVPGEARGWRLEIPVAGGASISVEGRAAASTPHLDLQALNEIVVRTCPAGRGVPPPTPGGPEAA